MPCIKYFLISFLAVDVFILSNKKPHVDLEMDVNQMYEHRAM